MSTRDGTGRCKKIEEKDPVKSLDDTLKSEPVESPSKKATNALRKKVATGRAVHEIRPSEEEEKLVQQAWAMPGLAHAYNLESSTILSLSLSSLFPHSFLILSSSKPTQHLAVTDRSGLRKSDSSYFS